MAQCFRFGASGVRCCGCDIFNDDFDRANDTNVLNWTEEAGSWEVLSNILRVVNSNAVAKCNISHPSGIDKYFLRTKVKATTTNDRARVICDYQDINNYLFGEIKFGTSTPYISVNSKSGGVDTVLHSLPLTAGTGMPPVGSFQTVDTCINRDTRQFTFQWGGQTSGAFVTPSDTGVFGLGTGAITSSIEFNDFEADLVSDECATCTQNCGSCIAGTSPTQIQADILGIINNSAFCTTCTLLNGTYIATQRPNQPCTYDVEFSPICNLNILTISTFTAFGVLQIRVRLGQVGAGGIGFTWARDYTTAPGPPRDCRAVINNFNVPFTSEVSDCGGTPTCVLTAL